MVAISLNGEKFLGALLNVGQFEITKLFMCWWFVANLFGDTIFSRKGPEFDFCGI